ncbi:MAG TPA: hypothetical protein PK854_12560 [Oscillospiraceae bacterium]|nr:hypothetical protein [Oscillospiraceae bacterium]HPS36083.1 hypothetical protein [Oscillospiraceae bacterium]
MKLACKIAGHRWNACKCTRCGETRNEQHDWQAVNGKCLEICAICGKQHELPHQWNGCKCERCGVLRGEGHRWVTDNPYIERCTVCGGTQLSAFARQENAVNEIIIKSEGLYDNRDAFLAAARSVTDQDLLLRLAEGTRVGWAIRSAAVSRLSDQCVLFKFAQDQELDLNIRKAAIRKLTDQTRLLTLLRDDNVFIRIEVIQLLTDQAILESLVSDEHNLARIHVIKKLTNRAFVQDLLQKPEHAEVTKAVRERLLILNDEIKCIRCERSFPKSEKAAGYAVDLCITCVNDLKPHEGGHLVFMKSDGCDTSYTCVKCGNSELISDGIPVGDMLYKIPCKNRRYCANH